MPELIAELPAVAILLPAASVYVLWALFHWIFNTPEDEPEENYQGSETLEAEKSLADTARTETTRWQTAGVSNNPGTRAEKTARGKGWFTRQALPDSRASADGQSKDFRSATDDAAGDTARASGKDSIKGSATRYQLAGNAGQQMPTSETTPATAQSASASTDQHGITSSKSTDLDSATDDLAATPSDIANLTSQSDRNRPVSTGTNQAKATAHRSDATRAKQSDGSATRGSEAKAQHPSLANQQSQPTDAFGSKTHFTGGKEETTARNRNNTTDATIISAGKSESGSRDGAVAAANSNVQDRSTTVTGAQQSKEPAAGISADHQSDNETGASTKGKDQIPDKLTTANREPGNEVEHGRTGNNRNHEQTNSAAANKHNGQPHHANSQHTAGNTATDGLSPGLTSSRSSKHVGNNQPVTSDTTAKDRYANASHLEQPQATSKSDTRDGEGSEQHSNQSSHTSEKPNATIAGGRLHAANNAGVTNTATDNPGAGSEHSNSNLAADSGRFSSDAGTPGADDRNAGSHGAGHSSASNQGTGNIAADQGAGNQSSIGQSANSQGAHNSDTNKQSKNSTASEAPSRTDAPEQKPNSQTNVNDPGNIHFTNTKTNNQTGNNSNHSTLRSQASNSGSPSFAQKEQGHQSNNDQIKSDQTQTGNSGKEGVSGEVTEDKTTATDRHSSDTETHKALLAPSHINPGKQKNRHFNLAQSGASSARTDGSKPKSPYKTAAKMKAAAPTAEVQLQLKTPDLRGPQTPSDNTFVNNQTGDDKTVLRDQLLQVKDEQIKALQNKLEALEKEALEKKALEQQASDNASTAQPSQQQQTEQNNGKTDGTSGTNIVPIKAGGTSDNQPGLNDDNENDSYKEKYQTLSAKLISKERRLVQLQSTVNDLQAAGITANKNSVKPTPDNSRPTLLSKVRVMTKA